MEIDIEYEDKKKKFDKVYQLTEKDKQLKQAKNKEKIDEYSSEFKSKKGNIAEELLSLAYDDKNLKIQNREIPKSFGNKISVFDIKFSVKQHEDKLYKNDKYFNNIRRGNTIIRIKDSETKSYKYEILRKGLPKFFDFEPEQVNKSDFSHEKKVLRPVKEHFKNNPNLPVFVYKTYKANGENVQIAYQALLDSWVICSKNVSLLVRNLLEVEEMSEIDEYKFAVSFGRIWFKMLDDTFKDEPEKLANFKRDLTGFTMIGESVGDPENQHIKHYQKHEFQFYSLVNNNSTKQKCLGIEETKALLEPFGFKIVPYTKSPLFYDYDSFGEYITKVFYEVLYSSLEEYGEGMVVYFAYLDEKN